MRQQPVAANIYELWHLPIAVCDCSGSGNIGRYIVGQGQIGSFNQNGSQAVGLVSCSGEARAQQRGGSVAASTAGLQGSRRSLSTFKPTPQHDHLTTALQPLPHLRRRHQNSHHPGGCHPSSRRRASRQPSCRRRHSGRHPAVPLALRRRVCRRVAPVCRLLRECHPRRRPGPHPGLPPRLRPRRLNQSSACRLSCRWPT